MAYGRIKEQLHNAYQLPETESGKHFVREHEKRSCKFSEILMLELKYMGPGSLAAFIALFFLSWAVVNNTHEEGMWIIASFLPLCSLVPMILLQSSERYQMDEIETTTRFSTQFLKLIRMLMLGVFSILSLALVCVIFLEAKTVEPADIIMYMLIPYLISIWGGLLVTRKWNRSESVYGVAAVSTVSALLPTVFREINKIAVVPAFACVSVLAALLTATAMECIKYVNERTDYSWNLS